jgi:FKBP-type peptidyl-prolyl cis-trans isomerase SlyD
MKFLSCSFVLLVVSVFMCFGSQCQAQSPAIKSGSQVSFDYTLTVDGKVADSSEGKAPMTYTQGSGQIIPGLDRQMIGLKAGDEKTIEVKPEEGYGMPNPAGIREVQLSQLPPDMKPEVGMVLTGTSKDGRTVPAKIIEVRKDAVVVDMNHPLAGKTLIFKIKIVSVK